jgi:hypothetical protein
MSDNATRAVRAAKAVQAYADDVEGLRDDRVIEGETGVELISDLLCDLHHLFDSLKLSPEDFDFEAMCFSAEMSYLAEREEQP